MIANSPTQAASSATSSTTRPDDRVGHLDGWRGLAILLVLQSHFLPLRGFDTGQLGVDIFFSLSGLLMSNLLFVRRVRLTDFYKRRISRILPAFVLFVFVVHGSATIAGVAWDWDEFFWTLLFMRTYLPDHPDIWNSSLPVGHLWSRRRSRRYLGLQAKERVAFAARMQRRTPIPPSLQHESCHGAC